MDGYFPPAKYISKNEGILDENLNNTLQKYFRRVVQRAGPAGHLGLQSGLNTQAAGLNVRLIFTYYIMLLFFFAKDV